MRSLHVRYLVPRKRKSGTTYYWSPSKKLRDAGFAIRRLSSNLSEAVDEAEKLNAELDRWYHGDVARHGPRPGTLQSLFDLFQRDDSFRSLKVRSQNDLINNMKLPLLWAGDIAVADISRKAVRTWNRAVRDERGPWTARNATAAFRRVLSFAVDEGWIAENPCVKMRLVTPASRERVWTLEERHAFTAAAIRHGRPSMALAVILGWCLGQRPADLRRLTWSCYDGKAMAIQQAKTDARIWVPCLPELRELLDSTPRMSAQIVVSEATGLPYRASAFEHLFAEIREMASLPSDLQFRDLRRTLATALGAAGCTDDQIRAITGHRTRAVVAVYVRPDRTFAEGAMKRLLESTERPLTKHHQIVKNTADDSTS